MLIELILVKTMFNTLQTVPVSSALVPMGCSLMRMCQSIWNRWPKRWQITTVFWWHRYCHCGGKTRPDSDLKRAKYGEICFESRPTNLQRPWVSLLKTCDGMRHFIMRAIILIAISFPILWGKSHTWPNKDCSIWNLLLPERYSIRIWFRFMIRKPGIAMNSMRTWKLWLLKLLLIWMKTPTVMIL